MPKYRIFVQLCGSAVVEGKDEQEALDNATNLSESDFCWDDVDRDLIRSAEIMEID